MKKSVRDKSMQFNTFLPSPGSIGTEITSAMAKNIQLTRTEPSNSKKFVVRIYDSFARS